MKKLDTQFIVAGVRRLGLVKASLDHLQEGFTESLSDMLNGLLGSPVVPVILFGCVNSGAGLVYNISAGSIMLNGEIYSVPLFAGTATGPNVPTLTLSVTYRAGDPVKYSDQNTFNTHIIRKLVWVIGAPGSGLGDFATAVPVNMVLNPITKANKAQVAWTNLTLINGWTNFSGNAKYRVDEFGKVHISANLQASGASSDVFAAIPGALTPVDDVIMNCTAFNGSVQVGAICSVSGTNLSILAKNTSYRYKIQGLSYWLDEA